uniref:polynucleotide adenylyltransferase n=1 Tax=Peronospora matthiolae TaxID=2874970 RepID=A0AAV1T4G6_9STRA
MKTRAKTAASRKAMSGRHDGYNQDKAVSSAEKKRQKRQIKAKAKVKHATKVEAKKRWTKKERLSSSSDNNTSDALLQPEVDDGFIQFEASTNRGRRGEDSTSGHRTHETSQEETDAAAAAAATSYAGRAAVDGAREGAERWSREELIQEMREIVKELWPGATVETFGSHYTQMFLPQSDIDMVLFGVPGGTEPLFKLAQCLEEKDLVSYLEVIHKARIPIVKMVHKASDIHVDVSFNVAGGLATGDLVKHFMRVYPSFRPLTLVLKYFMAQRGLNETYSGGVGSFLLQLMVVSFLQHNGRALGAKHDDPRFNNLGQLLVGFFTLYGRDFNYTDLGISVRNGGSYFYKEDRYWCDAGRPFLIAMENPNEPSLDVGKNSFEIRTVQRSFDYARQVLQNEICRHGRFKSLSGSILGTIIQGDSNLIKRDAPDSFGFDVLHHDPEKTAAIRKQYEMRRDEEMNKKRAAESAQQNRRRGGANDPPYKRWRERSSRAY